mmetsp:Transcript_10982/g.16156  ORF Transcript_10982/g.16156 Transcript_10982/m.16156 type:complete len:660 (+) Transcript_10982:124-2103(+)
MSITYSGTQRINDPMTITVKIPEHYLKHDILVGIIQKKYIKHLKPLKKNEGKEKDTLQIQQKRKTIQEKIKKKMTLVTETEQTIKTIMKKMGKYRVIMYAKKLKKMMFESDDISIVQNEKDVPLDMRKNIMSISGIMKSGSYLNITYQISTTLKLSKNKDRIGMYKEEENNKFGEQQKMIREETIEKRRNTIEFYIPEDTPTGNYTIRIYVESQKKSIVQAEIKIEGENNEEQTPQHHGQQYNNSVKRQSRGINIKYKTETFKAIDEHARKCNKKYKTITKLAEELTKKCKNELECVRAFYTWCATKIKFDTKAFYDKTIPRDNSPENVLKTRKSVCLGYAKLFQELCNHEDIHCEVVIGYAKGIQKASPPNSLKPNHAWNAVDIKEAGWLLMDCTWGAGVVNIEKKEFIVDYCDYYFATNPNELMQSHFPEQLPWQLTTTPMDYKTFINNITFKPIAYHYGIHPLTHFKSQITPETRNIKMSFTLPPSSNLLPKIDGYPHACLVYRYLEHRVEISVQLPDTSSPIYLDIYGAKTNQTLLKHICRYTIHSIKNEEFKKEIQLVERLNPPRQMYIKSPIDRALTINSIINFGFTGNKTMKEYEVRYSVKKGILHKITSPRFVMPQKLKELKKPTSLTIYIGEKDGNTYSPGFQFMFYPVS